MLDIADRHFDFGDDDFGDEDRGDELPLGHDRGDALWGGSPEHFLWWRPPVGPDASADVGTKMLIACAVWLVSLLALFVVIGVVVALTG